MDTATTDVDLLREEIATLRKEMEALRSQARVAPAQAITAEAEADEAPQSNRRGFLRLAGAAAVGATAVAVAGSAQPAAADFVTGGVFRIGQGNSSTTVNDTTQLQNPSSSALDDQTFRVDNWSSSLITIPSTHRIAVAATVSGVDTVTTSYRTGVYARSSGPGGLGGQGVFGSHEGVDNTFASGFSFGVFGTAEAGGYGVMGYNPTGTNSTGVLGRADAGIGVIASSFTGVSLLVRDSGRMQQQLRSTAGAPTTGTFSAGEQIRDANAELFICTVSGTPGTWRRVVTSAAASTTSGITLLPTPIRLFDTRSGSTAPLNNGKVPVPGNTTVTLQITGTVADGLSVPAGATGILGNLTIIGPAGDGYAQVWPSGAPPKTSNINYGKVNAAPALANYFISGLGAGGKINVLTYEAANVLLDVSGYVI